MAALIYKDRFFRFFLPLLYLFGWLHNQRKNVQAFRFQPARLFFREHIAPRIGFPGGKLFRKPPEANLFCKLSHKLPKNPLPLFFQ